MDGLYQTIRPQANARSTRNLKLFEAEKEAEAYLKSADCQHYMDKKRAHLGMVEAHSPAKQVELFCNEIKREEFLDKEAEGEAILSEIQSGTARFLLGFPLVSCLLVIPVALILCIPRNRAIPLRILVSCVVYMIVFTASHDIARGVRMMAFRELVERSTPLIEAINAYTLRHGEPPPRT